MFFCVFIIVFQPSKALPIPNFTNFQTLRNKKAKKTLDARRGEVKMKHVYDIYKMEIGQHQIENGTLWELREGYLVPSWK